jgi:hypothetical protein
MIGKGKESEAQGEKFVPVSLYLLASQMVQTPAFAVSYGLDLRVCGK